MTDPAPAATTAANTPDPALVSWTHWMYGLHALSAAIGIFSSWAGVMTAFIFGWPSIIAVIMNYAKRSDARGTWLESHFNWQLRTFWLAALCFVLIGLVSLPLSVVLIGFVTWGVGAAITGLWIVYRVVRGWLTLKDGRSIAA